MGSILSKIALKLLTEKFITKVTLALVGYAVEKTTNTLDNKLYEQIRDALG